MVFLLLGTVSVFLNVLFGIPVFKGAFNRWFMSFGLDAAGLAAFAGVLFLLIRRLMFPHERLLVPKPRPGFVFIEVVIGVIILTGFLLEALRIAHNGFEEGAFVGNWVAGLLGSGDEKLMFHQVTWWAHGLFAAAFIAYIPYSPLVHLVLVPINTGLAIPMPGPKMGVLDFPAFEDEEAEELPGLGVCKLTDFSRKRLLDFSSCLWCGRCHEVCPAAQTGKSLSPKAIIVTLSEYMNEDRFQDDSLLDEISCNAIYSCTTCAACMEVCPVLVNQPKAIMSMRQHLIMERSEIPEIMSQAHKSLEARQHPFFGTGSGPNDWRKEMDIPIFEKGKTEFLLWVGCATVYEERTQKVARSMVNILQKAGISFGILEENRCTGDPAKQMGNEFLFTEIAQVNIAEFNSFGVKKIITICPHCYNSFTRHYPPLGGSFTVIPHPVFINNIIASGKLALRSTEQTICYHDPCYLGRHNDVFEEPRRLVSSVGILVEMPRNRKNSFCCGGGGGNYWAEETGTRINQVRAEEVLDTGADFLATSCPFCLLMLTDGMKKFTEGQKIFDIAELVDLQLKDV
jgi:Fe-S oxidoreductase